MTQKDYTHITFLLDKSGSMIQVIDATVEGFNAYLEDQQKEAGKKTFSFIQFADGFERVSWFEPINQAKLISKNGEDNKVLFKPMGGTALLDTLCQAIDETGESLKAMKEESRPDKVIFVIVTDGQENSSRKFKYADVAERTVKQTESYGWAFVYIGSNQDAIAEAARMGINSGSALNYSPFEVRSTFGTASGYTTTLANSRDMKNVSFTPDQRAKSGG